MSEPTIESQLRNQLVTQKQANLDGIAKLQANVDAIDAKIAKFDEVFGSSAAPSASGSPAPTRKKPGPKPKAAAAKTAGKGGRKPGPKPKAAAAAKAPKRGAKKSNNRATQGRRDVAKGLRPSLKDSMTQVMGSKVMNASDVYEGLKAKGWLPNSNDPRQYISYSLSSFKDRFERIEGKRGYYRVKAGASVNGNAGPAKAAKAEPETSAPTTTESDVDAVLQDAGVLPTAAN